MARTSETLEAAMRGLEAEKVSLRNRILIIEQVLVAYRALNGTQMEAKPKPEPVPYTVPYVSPAKRLQGQYIGCMVGLTAGKRAQVKARYKKLGYRSAIKLARKLRG